MGEELKGLRKRHPLLCCPTTRAGAHFRNASHLAAASLFLFVFVFTALRMFRLFRALCGTLARKEKMCIHIRIDGSICQASRGDKIHLRNSSRSLAVHRRRRGCGNACPIYCTPRRCQGACSCASPRNQACDDEDSLRKELRKELRMVPLRATEGAADMPSPSCGAVMLLG